MGQGVVKSGLRAETEARRSKSTMMLPAGGGGVEWDLWTELELSFPSPYSGPAHTSRTLPHSCSTSPKPTHLGPCC